MKEKRSDLTLELVEEWNETQKISTQNGIIKREHSREGYPITEIRIESPEAAQKLGKPAGRYITMRLHPYFQRQPGFFTRGVRCLSQELIGLLPGVGREFSTFVVGLGNRSLTADAVGPLVLENLLVTRHMVTRLPLKFQTFSPVSALAPGVTGCTGLDTPEILQGIVSNIHPAAVILVDALAAKGRDHLCATIQLSDTGLVPGSGVGNHPIAINQEALGCPVIAMGFPTIISTAQLGDENEQELLLTPRDIDLRVRELSRLMGFAITAALQPALTLEDISGLLG